MTQAQPHFLVLPVEIKAKILGLLDDEALLTSRLVCSDWRRIVDDVHESNLWKPHFARQGTAEVLMLFRLTRSGTRFNNAEEVNQFMEDHQEEDENPFIDRTLIINSRTLEQHAGLCEVFPDLVARFGRFVEHCVYFINDAVPQSIYQTRTIFEMTNLRSLTMYCFDWSREVIRENVNVGNNGIQPLTYLNSLSVLGANSQGFLQVMSSVYGPQIKRLRYWHNEIYVRDPSATFPNLEELKVSDVSSEGLPMIASNRWPLKRLSVKFQSPDSWDGSNLGIVLNRLEDFAGTLESFHLLGKKAELLRGYYLPDMALQFPKVTDLRVPYFFKRRCIIEAMSRVFRNMRHLQLVDNEEQVRTLLENHGNRQEVIGELLEPLWATLPATLEMISVRYGKPSDLVAERRVIHKYFQKRTDLNRNRNN